MATISATGVGVRHAITRALATVNMAQADATFRVVGARVWLQGRARIARAEATLRVHKPRPVGEWEPERLRGLVNPDGAHPLMVRIPHERPFFLDIMPVTWDRWLRYEEITIPPNMDRMCPRTDLSWERAAEYAAWVGKRLPTEVEFRAAWGEHRFPWGDAPDPTLGRASPPRYDDVPEVGDHPPLPNGLLDLGAWLWQWTAEGTVAGGRDEGDPAIGVPLADHYSPLGFRLAQDG